MGRWRRRLGLHAVARSTSRIEDLTAGGEILISDSTLQSLQGKFQVGESQELNVKGIDESIVVHQIKGGVA